PDNLAKVTSRPWPGSDGRRHFYSLHDFFDPVKATYFPEFRSRLDAASAGKSTYDRYTYYRLLSMLGTDSIPESGTKININYKQNPDGTISNWLADDFFNTVAYRFMQQEYPAYATNGQLKILIAAKITNTVITAVSNYNAGR